jgi:hypothetical protein
MRVDRFVLTVHIDIIREFVPWSMIVDKTVDKTWITPK